jgi:hypothetical protein
MQLITKNISARKKTILVISPNIRSEAQPIRIRTRPYQPNFPASDAAARHASGSGLRRQQTVLGVKLHANSVRKRATLLRLAGKRGMQQLLKMTDTQTKTQIWMPTMKMMKENSQGLPHMSKGCRLPPRHVFKSVSPLLRGWAMLLATD